MLAHLPGLLAVAALAVDPGASTPPPAPPTPPTAEPPSSAAHVTPLARVAFEGGIGGGVNSFGSGAAMPDGAVLVLLDPVAVGVVAGGDVFGFTERQGVQTGGPPGSFRFKLPELYTGVALGFRQPVGARWAELVVELGAHPIWVARLGGSAHVTGSNVLPYLGARAAFQVLPIVAVGGAVRADLAHGDVTATTE